MLEETNSEDIFGNYNQYANPDEKYIQETIKALQDFLSDNTIKFIEQIFKQFNDILRTFEDYENIVNCYDNLINLVDNLIADGINHMDEHQTSNTKEVENTSDHDFKSEKTNEKLFPLFHLRDLASKIAYSKRIGFMRDILNTPDKKEILFSNVVSTEEGINKRYRKLASYFHPDKTSGLYIPTVLQDEYKNLGTELFNYVLELKNSLLFDLGESSKIGRLTFHEEKANEFWKIAIDYRNAHKAQWDKLKLLKKEDLEEIPSEKLQCASIDNAKLAYEEYRATCKLADKDKKLKSQIKLRGFMALCLYISNQFFEAQLYALSAVQLAFRNSCNVTQEDLYEAKNIFDKVKGGNPSESDKTQLNAEIKPKNSFDNPLALVLKNMDHEFSFFEQKNIHRSIKRDMEKICTDLMFKADRSLVRCQVNKEEILHAKKRANMHKIASGSVILSGAAVGTVLIAAVVGTAFSIAGVGTIITGLLGGNYLWKKGRLLLNEPQTREALNEIMKNALLAYDQGDHQKFFDELSKEYKNKKSLLTLGSEGYINHKEIIKTLLSHGFRSDGIAYLLNLIGEVLNSGKIKIPKIRTVELKLQGFNVLKGLAESKELEDEARKLDCCIKELRNKSWKRFHSRFMDFILIREYSSIANEHMNDAEEMPFVSRLEEMRNIARINLAISCILDGGPEEIEQAKEVIEKVQKSIISHHQYIGIAKTRLEVLEDFLWVVSGNEMANLQICF
jgi:hypothetical protein